MKSIAYHRGFYEGFCAKHKNSKYRRYREYAGYVDRFLHDRGVVDGMDYDRRCDKLPMPMNIYFMG